MSTTRRTAGVYSRPRPLGPNGERLCYNCHGPMPADGRKFNCSPKCSEEWRGKTSVAYMRHLLFKRDKGICALCRTDTIALKAEYDRLQKTAFDHPRNDTPRSQFLQQHGIPYGRAWGDWWDADHIKPVIEGGGECGLDNLRTLCIPCHQAETRRLHGRLKEKRDQELKARADALEARPLGSLSLAEIRELKGLRLKFRTTSAAEPAETLTLF